MPATTLWWDGIAIATNTSDENAEASFRALVGAASSAELANNYADATHRKQCKHVWFMHIGNKKQ